MKKTSIVAALFGLSVFLVISFRSGSLSQEEGGAAKYAGADKCAMCHRDLNERWQKTSHQRTLKQEAESLRGCEACHGPGSRHIETTGDTAFITNLAKLSTKEVEKLCAKCHSDTDADAGASSDWKKIAGKHWEKTKHSQNDVSCLKCHSIHGNEENLLKMEKRELCLSCHDSVRQPKEGSSFVHMPVKTGVCAKCHDPHGSSERHMVRENIASVCSQCHDIGKTKTAHSGYDMTGKNCTLCHSPHSKDKKGKLIAEYKHAPFKAKQCKLCHGAPGDPEPFKLKSKPEELCLSCHKADYEKFLSKGKNVHYPVEKKFCLGCHAPHASRYKEMTKESVSNTCFQCHSDVENATLRPHKHQPVSQGLCLACHDAKGSDNKKLMKTPIAEKCSSCHKTQGMSSHPLGENLVTPGSGVAVKELTCASCHHIHGSEFEYILSADRSGLCYKCHTL